jgi:hypothetical protein
LDGRALSAHKGRYQLCMAGTEPELDAQFVFNFRQDFRGGADGG